MTRTDPKPSVGLVAVCSCALALSCAPGAYEPGDGGTEDASEGEPCPYLRPPKIGGVASFEYRSGGTLQHTYDSEVVAVLEFEGRSAVQYAGRQALTSGDVHLFDVYESRGDGCELYLWQEADRAWVITHRGAPSPGETFETFNGIWKHTWGPKTSAGTPAGDFSDCFELESVANEGEATEVRVREVWCRGVGLVVRMGETGTETSNTLVAYDW